FQLLETGTRLEDIQAARANVARAQARTTFWEGEYRRIEQLYRQRSTVTESEYNNARQELEAAKQSEGIAQAELEKAVAGPRSEEIKAASAQAAAAQQSLSIAKRQLQKGTLVAPFDGKIQARMIDPGAYINVFPSGGAPVVRLVDLRAIDAVLAVSERERDLFRAGDSLQLASAVRSETRATGKVSAVGELADPASGTYEVRVRMMNNDLQFTGGMVVTAEVKLTDETPRIQVPLTAVRSGYGQTPYVLLAEEHGDGNVVVTRSITLGPVHGNMVAIDAGLSGGEQLIVRGQHLVLAGDAVRVRHASEHAVAQKP
ncbi:MAG: efflux RND transporter periplasmic adaptor subunit, partial [Planctomycetales bacterium]|nr:efflux RND transporter periplasmic adaptor subunit [Planctomycetales bacterium]